MIIVHVDIAGKANCETGIRKGNARQQVLKNS